tara:strand:+ start:1567 stop:2160 length:594 start_codon:yes stop_codon:yes gene_type:complete
MKIKKIVIIFFISILTITLCFFVYFNFFKKKPIVQSQKEKEFQDTTYNSNIIKNIYYSSKDSDGNEYIIKAEQGEIDFTNSNILFLTKVNGLIKLKKSDDVTISSDFGKYNTDNFDTIFSKNVIINYLNTEIDGEYLDFSISRNSMLISKDVIYNDVDNTLKADAMEINLSTKDTRIFMYEEKKKVNVKSRDYNGNN